MVEVNMELVRYRQLTNYTPKMGDFIIYIGWMISRWYGVISAIDKDEIVVIKDGVPSLLFTMNESNYSKNTIRLELGDIIDSSPGAYSVLQDGVWYVHG